MERFQFLATIAVFLKASGTVKSATVDGTADDCELIVTHHNGSEHIVKAYDLNLDGSYDK